MQFLYTKTGKNARGFLEKNIKKHSLGKFQGVFVSHT